MFFNPTVTLVLATLASTVTSAPKAEPAFSITLTNTNLSMTSAYTASGDGTPVIVESTTAFDLADLKCLLRFHIPEYHCLLQDKSLNRSVDLGPGQTQIAEPMDVGRITCGWRLPESQS